MTKSDTKQVGANVPRRGEPIEPEVFRTIADCTYDWESWHNGSAELLWVNSAVERFTGFSPSECMAMDDYPFPLIAKEDHPRFASYIEQMVTGSTENNIEFNVVHRDGSNRWVAISWQPMIDAKGRSLGFRVSTRDIAEKRAMREQLRLHNEHLEQLVQERTARVAELERHRSKMERLASLGELAAGVAHEINNPLAGIRNALLLIKRHLPTDTKHFDMFELIDREIDRISGITHQMYRLYRPSQQEETRFSIRRTLEEVILLSLPLSRKTQVEAVTRFETMSSADELEPDNVVLREGELKQVLLNLVHNAMQASQPGQMVTISIGTTSRFLRITVSDQGHGITEENIDHVFDPFFSTKAEAVGQGMGLGLAVTRSIVEAMKGTIEVTSEVNVGTRFTVTLPRRLR
ncbi:two-component system sensor histidine kinase NtrB [Novipirellula sp. SH528]|uniref:two-component system sensor histidine kinase NtrB n=1 Tax=Novipirellula sp. SH528 TaxID=3454466 RepID=UPI003FA0B265